MFEDQIDLTKVSTTAATGAVYRALTELFEIVRRKDSRKLKDIRNEVTHSRLPLPEKKVAGLLAVKILQEIEASKKKELSELTDSELRQISKALARTLEQIIAADPLYDKRIGKQVLDDLRKEYATEAAVVSP